MPHPNTFRADGSSCCPSCGAPCLRRVMPDESLSDTLYDAGTHIVHVCRGQTEHPDSIRWREEAVRQIEQTRPRETLESMTVAATYERVRDAWTEVSTAQLLAPVNVQVDAGSVSRMVREVGEQYVTGFLFEGARMFAQWLTEHQEWWMNWRADECDIEPVLEAFAEHPVFNGHVSRPVPAPAPAGGRDAVRADWWDTVLETREEQIRRHGDDQRPEVNELWWIDLLGFYGDKALGGGRQNGAWKSRMIDIAALALAATEWAQAREEQTDAGRELPSEEIVSHPYECACPRCAHLGQEPPSRTATETISVAGADLTIRRGSEVARDHVRRPRSQHLTTDERTLVRRMATDLSAAQEIDQGAAEALIGRVIDGTGYRVAPDSVPQILQLAQSDAFFPNANRVGRTFQMRTMSEMHALGPDGVFRRVCPDCHGGLEESDGVFRCNACGYSECG